MGYDKTLEWIIARFFLIYIRRDMHQWCASCPKCQLKVALHPLLLMKGPHWATEDEWAISLCISSGGLCHAISQCMVLQRCSFSHRHCFRSSPHEASQKDTDWPGPYTLKEVHELLGIKSVWMSVYHPQTDELVEYLNKTVKSTIH